MPLAAQWLWPDTGHRQALLEHTWALGHAFVHDPQCWGSVRRSKHASRSVQRYGVALSQEQRPNEQNMPAPQTLPHAPQFLGSLSVSRQTPPHSMPRAHEQKRPLQY